MARLAASHRRCRAHRGKLPATRVGKAAYPESDGNAARLSALRLDAHEWPPSESDRRLSAVDARQMSRAIRRHREFGFCNSASVNNGDSGDIRPGALAVRS